MKPKHVVAEVATIPRCDLCSEPAHADGKTQWGPWAYMCKSHFAEHGVGLGLGLGQMLVVRDDRA